ncbi:uncharacterized protein LOC142584951 isoform X1 [Dermacentor variabilis]|uniref:uncharacterized protein LOC142584951 isoform X1 n=1 Tax=Dermacentor variabilis TaxID=34621 RepID=UPI003F5C0FC7
MALRKNGAESRSSKNGTVYCCVYGCHNSYRNTAGKLPRIKFYGFPWKSYEKERRERWILAVRRARPEGGLWQPVKNRTRICSAHFVGNERSSIDRHPAYVPTIFPACYGKGDDVAPATKPERFQQLELRGSAAVGGPPIHTAASGEALPQEELLLGIAEKPIAFASVMTQTEEDQSSGCCSLFLSVSSGGSACTQVRHSNTIDAAVQAVPTTLTTSTGSEECGCVSLGYDSLIECTHAFRELCGVSTDVCFFADVCTFIHKCLVGRCTNFAEARHFLDETEAWHIIHKPHSAFWFSPHSSKPHIFFFYWSTC